MMKGAGFDTLSIIQGKRTLRRRTSNNKKGSILNTAAAGTVVEMANMFVPMEDHMDYDNKSERKVSKVKRGKRGGGDERDKGGGP